MDPECTGVILAGGRNKRFGGREKAFVTINGITVFEMLYRLLRPLCKELMVVTNKPLNCLDWDLHIVTDLLPIRSSLTGVHSALYHASGPFVFITACDTPFLKPELVRLILSRADARMDLVVPATSKGLEPLCGLYHKKALEAVQRHLKRGRFQIQSAFRPDRVKTISEKSLRSVDPELISFFNMNTPDDLARADRWVSANQTQIEEDR